MASYHNGHFDVNFLDLDSNSVKLVELPYLWVDITWLPDGSGILVFNGKTLSIVFLNGEEKRISFTTPNTLYRPRYSADGQSIYLSQDKNRSKLWLNKIDGELKQLTSSDAQEYLGIFSRSGKKYAFVSKRNSDCYLFN